MRLRTPLVASATLALGLGLTLVPAAVRQCRTRHGVHAGRHLVLKDNRAVLDGGQGRAADRHRGRVGVTPRAGTDVASLPDPLPLSVVLADHRAGDEQPVHLPLVQLTTAAG